MARIENFDPTKYGAAGLGMKDIEELQGRGHSYDEINDYFNSQYGRTEIGGKAEQYLAEQGREQRDNREKKAREDEEKLYQKRREEEEATYKKRQSKERAANYVAQNQRSTSHDFKSGDFTGGQKAMLESKFGQQDNSYKPKGAYQQKYDFNKKEFN